MEPSLRLGVFIDGGHLDAIAYKEKGIRVDHFKLRDFILGFFPFPYEVRGLNYYDCLPFQHNPPWPGETDKIAGKHRNFAWLESNLGYQIRQGKLVLRTKNQRGLVVEFYEQKRVDVWLTVDLLRMSVENEITHAAILTADSDYIPAIEYVRSLGKYVALFHGVSANWDLTASVDIHIELTNEILNSIRR